MTTSGIPSQAEQTVPTGLQSDGQRSRHGLHTHNELPLSQRRRSSQTLTRRSPALSEKSRSSFDKSSKKDNFVCSHCNERKFTDNTEAQHTADAAEKPSWVVGWDGPDDPSKPMNWSKLRKWATVGTCGLMTFVVSFASSVFSSATTVTAEEFGVSNEVMLLGVALYVVGFAFGPMVYGPASELYGRTIPLFAGMIVFIIFQIPLAVAQNLRTVLIARFFAGLFGSAPLAILGGMYADFLEPVDLGIAISVFSAGTFMGPALGPVVGSFVVESYLGWRWIAWITMIMGVFFTALCLVVSQETYEPVLLHRRAKQRRFETQNFAWHATCEKTPTSAKTFVTKYLSKPILMFMAEPILVVLTIYCSIVYGILYLTFAAYPITFVYTRGWSPSIGSLPFFALLVGILIACLMIGVHSVYFVGRRYHASGKLQPEDRLPTMIVGSVLLPAGLFWFAWTSDPSIPWPAQVFSGIPIGCGIILVFMSAIAYLVDVYLIHANSALAISTFIRSLVAAGFPMFATYMYSSLGVNWATSVLGFVCVALIPFPLLFWKYGKKIRSWSKFAIVLPG